MPIVRQTDTTTRSVTTSGTTELQRIDLSAAGENLLALKGVAEVEMLTGGTAELVLRSIDDNGAEVYRSQKTVVDGGVHTVALRDAVKGPAPDSGIVETTAVVLELETDLPGHEVVKTQVTAIEFEGGTGTVSMRSAFHDNVFVEATTEPVKLLELVKNTDAKDVVPWHGVAGWAGEVLSMEAWLSFMHDNGSGHDETFRVGGPKPLSSFPSVHIDEAFEGFDTPDGSLTIDKIELWVQFNTTKDELEFGDQMIVGVEV